MTILKAAIESSLSPMLQNKGNHASNYDLGLRNSKGLRIELTICQSKDRMVLSVRGLFEGSHIKSAIGYSRSIRYVFQSCSSLVSFTCSVI